MIEYRIELMFRNYSHQRYDSLHPQVCERIQAILKHPKMDRAAYANDIAQMTGLKETVVYGLLSKVNRMHDADVLPWLDAKNNPCGTKNLERLAVIFYLGGVESAEDIVTKIKEVYPTFRYPPKGKRKPRRTYQSSLSLPATPAP